MSNATEKILSLLRSNARRLLKLYFPHDDGPDVGLLVNRLDAKEYASKDFEYIVTVISDDSRIALTDVQGRMVCVELMRDDGSNRYFNGYCFEFALTEVENGLAQYTMVLRPWLALFKLRHDWRLFHNQSITDQTKTIFLETGLASHEFKLHDSDPIRTFSCQYDETDYNYLHRRWEEIGWHYWYEHKLYGHKLVLGDSSLSADAVDGQSELVLHHGGGSNKTDKISKWQPKRKLVSGRAALSSFDFKRPSPEFVAISSDDEQGDVHAFEVYRYQALYGFKGREQGARHARLRMEAISAPGLTFQAQSNCRAIQPGRWFRLKQDHPGLDYQARDQEDEFFVISVHHKIDNNYLNSAGGDATYENSFVCVARGTPWRPLPGFNSREVKVGGSDTATVTSAGSGDIHTDEYGRVRVRFHWDRKARDKEQGSAWIRVASNWAGAELGVMTVPRAGSEVIVQWLSGSPDRPIIVGVVYNSRNMPPWQLPAQQALSGLRSRELVPGGGNTSGGRSNHVILDDTYEKIQVQVKSDHQCSQLSLGYVTRIEDNAGRKDARGEGFELRTDGWGALRAGKGLLITTEGRGNATSTVKDMPEAAAILKEASEQHAAQAKDAINHGGQIADQQDAVAEKLKKQVQAVAGKNSANNPFPELTEPHMVLSSPTGLLMAAKNIHAASDETIALTTAQDLSHAVGNNWFASIKNSFRLFVHRAGMKMIAAAGNIDIEALSQNINLLAKLKITETAQSITITGTKEVIINGAGSYIKLNAAGIEQGTGGNSISHAAHHSLVGAKSLAVETPHLDAHDALAEEDLVEEFFNFEDEKGAPVSGLNYKMEHQGGKLKGKVGANGETMRIRGKKAVNPKLTAWLDPQVSGGKNDDR